VQTGLQSKGGNIRFALNLLRQRLWVKPLLFSVLSVGAVLLSGFAGHLPFSEQLPNVTADSVETLLKIISASMLVIAVFAVGAMLSAYNAASNSATPRSFPVVIADDVSQNALSVFIGAFIFSLVALVAITNGFFNQAGRFAIFILTLLVFAIVVLSFVRWVDRIARLGRLASTIEKLEAVTNKALSARRRYPTLGANPSNAVEQTTGWPVNAEQVGYIQRIDMVTLQNVAEAQNLSIAVNALPGCLAWPDRPLAYVNCEERGQRPKAALKRIAEAFVIGDSRTFSEDPRFGLVVLSEIASRALSPAVNDAGTAMGIITTQTRLLAQWAVAEGPKPDEEVEFDRISAPAISMEDMFDDAFNAMSRDGAGVIEVGMRLQRAFRGLAALENEAIRRAAVQHGHLALHYAQEALKLPEEQAALAQAAGWLRDERYL